MKYLKYLNYLLHHKWYVMLECFKHGLYWRGLVHDMSKFLPSEFLPYARSFYGNYASVYTYYGDKRNRILDSGDYQEKVDEDFNMAWLNHQNKNKHHWQYWVLLKDSGNTVLIDIPEVYRTEMLCDWMGAGKAQGKISPKEDPLQETRKWWCSNNHKMQLHPNTREYFDKILLANGTH